MLVQTGWRRERADCRSSANSPPSGGETGRLLRFLLYNWLDADTETVARYGIIFIWKLSNGLVSGFYDFEFHEDPR